MASTVAQVGSSDGAGLASHAKQFQAFASLVAAST